MTKRLSKNWLLKVLTVAEDFLLALDDYFRHPLWVVSNSGREPNRARKSAERMVTKGFLSGDFSLKDTEKSVLSQITKPWDGKWRLAGFDIPEKDRKLRKQIRVALYELGLRKLQKSVWITPLAVDDFIAEIKKDFGNPADFFIFTGRLEGVDPKKIIKNLWEIDLWKKKAEVLLKKMTREGFDKAIKVDFWNLVFDHPKVPLELLPVDWPLEKLVKTFVAKAKSEGKR